MTWQNYRTDSQMHFNHRSRVVKVFMDRKRIAKLGIIEPRPHLAEDEQQNTRNGRWTTEEVCVGRWRKKMSIGRFAEEDEQRKMNSRRRVAGDEQRDRPTWSVVLCEYVFIDLIITIIIRYIAYMHLVRFFRFYIRFRGVVFEIKLCNFRVLEIRALLVHSS